MVIDKEVVEKYINAGKIGNKAFKEAQKILKVGGEVKVIVEKLEDIIKKEGGNFAFPINFSINEVAAHDTARENDNRVLKEGDVVKIDIGVHIDGYIADMAKTFIIGEDIKGFKEMVKANEKALKEVVKSIRVGMEIKEIGEIVENIAEKEGYAVVANLTGHGIKRYDIHSDFSILNIRNNDDRTLKEGDVIAIEPFFAEGKGKAYVKDGNSTEIFTLVNETKSPLSRFSKILMQEIKKKYNDGLPFASRWLTSLKGFAKKKALDDLMREGILHGYPVLVERNKKVVSQAEATVIVLDKSIILKPEVMR